MPEKTIDIRGMTMNRITKTIRIAALFSVVILLLLSGYVMGEDEDDVHNSGTRGILIMVDAVCVDYHHSILPEENTTYEIVIMILNYYDTIDIRLWLENVPLSWNAALNQTNFTVTNNNRCNVTLFVSPPKDVSIGSEADIKVAGTWMYKDENSDGDEIKGNISKTITKTKIIGPDLWAYVFKAVEPEQKPKVGQQIDFVAKIRNYGDVNATNVSVWFKVDGKQVGSSRTIPFIEAKNYTNESFSWVAKEGEHTLTVEVDFNNTIEEYNEYNNDISLTMSIDDPFKSFLPYICSSLLIVGFLILLIFYRKKKKKEDKQVTLDYFAK